MCLRSFAFGNLDNKVFFLAPTPNRLRQVLDIARTGAGRANLQTPL